MAIIDDVRAAAERFAQNFAEGHLPAAPARRLAVVTCMDARISVEQILGLKLGDAHIVRNAGGLVTDDVIRSLVFSHHVLFTQEIMVFNHTECGLLEFKGQDLYERLRQVTGKTPVAPASFLAFNDLEANVRLQVDKIRSHPWIPQQVVVRGFIYDVRSGKLREIL